MMTIRLEGELADLFIDTIDLAVSTVGEAIRALKANFDGFFDYLQKSSSRGVYYKVYVGHQQVGEPELICPIAKKVKSIRIVPIFMGAGGEGTQWWQILAGVGLIAAAFVLPAIGIKLGNTLFTASQLATVGSYLLLSGILSIFQPKKEPDKEEKQSNSFSPLENAGEGGRVPVVYGIMMVGIVPISVKLDSNIVR
ncbi:Lambda-like tail assembly protein I [Cylindrospermopsis raciborskii virus RM-2018a]|jgi:predicted phage tail protein|nr:Lambda-like tail assembly protein I [Cylindrospermopsis raciborskii virus RM-2018a]WHL30604.1 tail assembly protein I [Cylindrospermopsis phage Cr-LKS4]